MLNLLTGVLATDVPPGPYPWDETDWTVPAVAAFLVLSAAVIIVAVVLIRRGRR